MRGPIERQGYGAEQSNSRVEAGCQFPDGSKERRETGARGHQGRVVARNSRRSGYADERMNGKPRAHDCARGFRVSPASYLPPMPTFRSGLLYHPSAQVLEIELQLGMRGIMKRVFFRLAMLFLAVTAPSPAQTPPAPLISPDVHSDNRVTFRFRGPNVKEAAVSLEGVPKPIPMEKDDQGVWSVTTDPLAPDYYSYSIVADGVGMFDPSNHSVKPNFLYRASEAHVPGPASLSWEIGAVPHGEIHHHFYKSGVVGD